MQDEQPSQPLQPIAQQPVPSPKKSNNKLLMVLLALAILFSGLLAVYFLVIKKNNTDNISQNNTESIASDVSNSSLYFQVNTKIYAYDTEARAAKVIYDKLPDGAEVLDFYRDGSDWRAYYLVANEGDVTIYLSKNGTDTKLVETTDNYPVTDANADLQLLAYSLVPDGFDNKTTRTYVVSGTSDPELVYESDEYDFSDSGNVADLKNALYHMSQLSPDGKKLLFSRSACYQCDGSSPGYFAELDLESKQMTLVDLGEVRSYRRLEYARDGRAKFYLYDSNNRGIVGGMGDYEGYDVRISHFTNPAQKTVIFEESNGTWQNASLSPNLSLLVVSEYDDPSDWKTEHFKGLYEVKGQTVDELHQRVLAVPDGLIVRNISDELAGCITMTTDYVLEPHKNGVAVSCLKDDAYTFEVIAENNSPETFLVAKLL